MLAGATEVLLVEDNDGDALLIEEALRESAASSVVRRATRLDDGLRMAAEGAIDVVLLDLSLPDSSGLDTVEVAVAQLPTVAIVVLTGTDDTQLAERAVHLGAQDYLVKGRYDPGTLLRVVRYAIERQSVMRMLRESNQELATANHLKDDFIAIASHELRTPVTVISGAVQTMLERWGDLREQDRARFLRALGRQADRLVALVEDLLVLSRVERGILESRSDPTDLAAAVEAAVEGSRVDAAAVRVSVPRMTVVTDAEYLTRVLVNLLDNAAKYGDPPIEVGVAADVEGFALWVRDHGPGVDPRLRSRLFERFVRSEMPEVRREPGTGLGLAIVDALARAMGGEVSHDRPADGGARFTVRLPSPAVSAPGDDAEEGAPAGRDRPGPAPVESPR